jgi:5-methyltetrahydrofolate corrinoid/iron sulfur protein methyltransferase
MIIIGEKINGAIPSVSEAISRRDEAFIRELVRLQVNAGANYLDVCAGRAPENEKEEMTWLIGIIQSETEMPLCVDSPNPRLLREVLPLVKSKGIVNSISGEGDKCDVLLPIIRENGWDVIALTCDELGIPAEAKRKTEIAFRLIEKCAEYDIAPERIYIDPLVLALSAVNDSMLNFMQAITDIKARYPTVRFTSGLSNISYGMPYRKIINQLFLALAMSAGMNSAIVDPTNRDMAAAILAAEALLNKDRCCRNYNKAYRAGKIGPPKA